MEMIVYLWLLIELDYRIIEMSHVCYQLQNIMVIITKGRNIL